MKNKEAIKKLVDELGCDPNRQYFEPDMDLQAQAEIILNGRGDCDQCSGYGCITCCFTGEK